MTDIIDPFWSKKPMVLFRTDRLLEFFITPDQSVSEKLNSIVRFGIYTSIVLAMYQQDWKYLTLSILTFIITYLIYDNLDLESKEKFQQLDSEEEISIKDSEKYTLPTINNPFGNNSVIDIIDNPTKKPMIEYADHSDKSLEVKEKIEKAFNYNLYKDLGDLYGKQNSQRQFYTTPSRGVIPQDPNGDFKKWLYGNMSSCKDNMYDCIKRLHEPNQRKRQVFGDETVNPTNIEARQN